MTLPFRGRHHDNESGHDRARALTSAEMLEPISGEDAAWLARHLDACAECRRDREAYLADRELLRSLRGRELQPPRDLWARTAAAIDREAGRSRRRRAVAASGRAASRDIWRGFPLGAAASALIVVVVVGASIISPRVPHEPPPGTQPVAVLPSPDLQPTPIALPAADPVAWIRPTANGRWELVISDVDQVCPASRQGCGDLGANDPARPLDLGGTPSRIAISPTDDQLVFASDGNGSEDASVYVVPVPTARPEGSAPPTSASTTAPPATPAPPTSNPTPSAPSPPATPATPAPPTTEPTDATASPTPTAIPIETPDSTPDGALRIASGVDMVGEAAYSSDGAWLAFSARPADDSAGPDLYIWHVGDPAAVAVTSDHQTYFSGWLGGAILASRVVVSEPTGADESADPNASAVPGEQTSLPSGEPAEAASPDPVQAHPVSFLLDPATLEETELTQPDVWLPVVDPDGTFTAYWSGTLLPAADGLRWRLGEGSLVLDRWVDGRVEPAESAPASADASGEPTATRVKVGPAGEGVDLQVGSVGTFQARFDPEGARLALWTADEPDASIGRLQLVVLDVEKGTVDASVAPLPGVPALRRFSIDRNRLAWVSPRGQDGRESAVQVLGWSGRDFGEIHTIPAKDLLIVR